MLDMRKFAKLRLSGRIKRSLLWFALLAWVFCTGLAFTQNVRLSPWQTPGSLLSWDYWRFPVERNAILRMSSLSAYLKDVFALPGTDEVWAVGEEGLIVHSNDGGRHWQIQPSNSKVNLNSVYFAIADR